MTPDLPEPLIRFITFAIAVGAFAMMAVALCLAIGAAVRWLRSRPSSADRLTASAVDALVEGQRLSNYSTRIREITKWSEADVDLLAKAMHDVVYPHGGSGDATGSGFRILACRLLLNGWRGTL